MYENDSVIKRGMKDIKEHNNLVKKAIELKSTMPKEQFLEAQESIILEMCGKIETEVSSVVITANEVEMFENGEADLDEILGRLLKKYEEALIDDNEKGFLKEFSSLAIDLIKICIKYKHFTL